MQNWISKKKKKLSTQVFPISQILGRSEKGKQTSFFFFF